MNEIITEDDLRVQVNYRSILKQALPICFAILIPQLNFITNTIFLGHYSEEAMAVAGITGVYYLVFSAIGPGLSLPQWTLDEDAPQPARVWRYAPRSTG